MIPSFATLPTAYTIGQPIWIMDTKKVVAWTGTMWLDLSAVAAASSFLGLSDTPSSYADQANGVVIVNDAESGLDFTAYVPGAMEEHYRWNIGTDVADPGSGKVRVNNADATLATALCINDETTDDQNASYLYAAITRGDLIAPVDRNSVKGHVYVVTGQSVNHTGWHEIPVEIYASLGSFDKNESLLVAVALIPPSGFTDLNDTPEDYAGHGGQTVKVKVDETGLEFVP